MNKPVKDILIIASFVVLVQLLLFGGSMATGTTMSGGMMGSGMMGGSVSWMWIPTLLTAGLGIIIGWALLDRRADDKVNAEIVKVEV